MKDSETIQWLWSTIRDAASNLKEVLPTPELKTLWEMIVAFADKVSALWGRNPEKYIRSMTMPNVVRLLSQIVNNKPYDANTELKNISVQTMHGIRSLISNDLSLQSVKDLTDNLVGLSPDLVNAIVFLTFGINKSCTYFFSSLKFRWPL